MPVPTYQWKDLLIDFVTGLPISINWKGDSYDSILVIIDWLTRIINYKLVKITIDAPSLAKVIIDVVVWHHGLPDSIVTNRGSLFTSKFWSSFCYFLGIKCQLSNAFYLQIDGQTEQQNSTIETYLQVFVNFGQNDWAKLLAMAEFAYNNAKNASTSHTPFELNCNYHPCVFFKKDTNPCSQSKTADKLLVELWELMIICRENLSMLKSFKSKLTIKTWSLRAIHRMTKFGQTSIISRPNRIGSWRPSSLDRFKCYIQ